MNEEPPALNETEPASRLPLPVLGVLNRQDATPLADLPAPFTFAPPSDAAQEIFVGRTGEPPLVTRTEATTVEPAFGRVGESLTALAFALADAPPPPPPPLGSATTIVIAEALFEVSLSVSDSVVISARNVYVPFCGATAFQNPPELLWPAIGWRSPISQVPLDGVATQCSLGSGASDPQPKPGPSSIRTVPLAAAGVMSETSRKT